MSKSVYESWGPEDLDPELHPFYEVTPTGDLGCDSGRARFFVKCKRCGQVLHENTTGPTSRIRTHEGLDGCDFAKCKKLLEEE